MLIRYKENEHSEFTKNVSLVEITGSNEEEKFDNEKKKRQAEDELADVEKKLERLKDDLEFYNIKKARIIEELKHY